MIIIRTVLNLPPCSGINLKLTSEGRHVNSLRTLSLDVVFVFPCNENNVSTYLRQTEIMWEQG